MSRVFFIGDLHFGHTNVTRFRTEFSSVQEHDEYIQKKICETVSKNDVLIVLGDAAFTIEGLERFKNIPCRKILVRGNHDVFSPQRYLIFFEDIHGIYLYKGFWLSHAPIHPDELRGRKNIHGHVHTNTITKLQEGIVYNGKTHMERAVDERYVNVSAEVIDYTPIALEEIKNGRVYKNNKNQNSERPEKESNPN